MAPVRGGDGFPPRIDIFAGHLRLRQMQCIIKAARSGTGWKHAARRKEAI